MKRLVKVWLKISAMAAQSQLLTNWSGILFIIGKIVRFLLFFVFLFRVISSAGTLAGYSCQQVIFFFLVFNLVDIATQFLFRGVYRFRFAVASGEYDLDLLKPLPSFFRPVFGWTDILDLIVFVPFVVYFTWFTLTNHLLAQPSVLPLFIFLLVNSLVLSFAFHLFVCSLCILTLSIDHLVWIYRDLTNMARFPTDIYHQGVQYLLTFTIPVIVLITVPAKALLGLLSWSAVFFSFLAGGFSLYLSLRFWHYALTRYSSASS